ncbi:MAG: glycosyltransferase family 39 protein [Victivallaceae bacterium]|nr:glycosyltransferase family 39 protein [Victivallaceae bacterium]
MGPYKEKAHALWISLLVVTVVAAAIYLPWVVSGRELFRQEGLYAVEATEFHFRNFLVTAHQVALKNGFPLYPALVSLAVRWTHCPVETVMRTISVLMLFLTAAVVFFGAKSTHSPRAGVVAAAIYLTSLISLEKGWEGNPVTLNAFFLLAAQLLFFYYGARGAWNKAWISAAIFLAFGFLSGGFRLLFFFIFPMLFFRRPFSVRSKFHRAGFVAGVILLGIAVGFWAFPYARWYGQMSFDYQFWGTGTAAEFFRNFWEFPLKFFVRLLPWSLIVWLPFCAALQELDPTPIYNRYLRTLVAPTVLILWLIPEYDSREMLYMLGPLAILCGNAYEPGMRRYGIRLRKILVIGEYAAAAMLLLITVMAFVPETWLAHFASIENSLHFREAPGFFKTGLLCYALGALLWIAIHCGRHTEPVSRILLLVAASIGVFYSGILARYQEQSNEKRIFGGDLAAALKGEPSGILYKGNISDLYGGLYYSGAKVVKLPSLENLPQQEKVVYVIDSTFPPLGDRSWRNLLPPFYEYRGCPIGLWQGILLDEEE